MLTAQAMVSDSYFATMDSRRPIETQSTPFLISDFDNEAEYKAVFSTNKSRALALLNAVARIWPEVALGSAHFLTEQAVRGLMRGRVSVLVYVVCGCVLCVCCGTARLVCVFLCLFVCLCLFVLVRECGGWGSGGGCADSRASMPTVQIYGVSAVW